MSESSFPPLSQRSRPQLSVDTAAPLSLPSATPSLTHSPSPSLPLQLQQVQEQEQELHPHDAFSPSLIAHAARHHSNKAKTASHAHAHAFINIFSCNTLSSKYRKQWSLSFSNGSSPSHSLSHSHAHSHTHTRVSDSSSCASFFHSDDDEHISENSSDHSSTEIYLDDIEVRAEDSLHTLNTEGIQSTSALNLNALNLRVTISEDEEEGTWAHNRHVEKTLGLSLRRSTSGDSQHSTENRRYSVLKTPKGTLHVKGFSEGIGQFGISRGASTGSSTSDVSASGSAADPLRLLTRGDSLLSVPEISPCTLLPMKDRLVVLSKLGQGASSIVYKAFDITRMKLVALKTVPIYDKEKRRQMARELNTLYNILREKKAGLKMKLSVANPSTEENQTDSLESFGIVEEVVSNIETNSFKDYQGLLESHIVEFYDAFSDLEDAVALVVEYMDGGSLQDLVDAGGCASEAVLANISTQALEGLNFLHRHCQIHRDIKPANLLINLNGDVKVSDLGILREVDPAVDTNHFVHTYIGTATYMSPERIDALDYSYSSDIWSFGLTMLTLSFGKLPDQVSGGYWTILSNMHDKPSPSLTDDDNPQHNWSEEYIDFISQCLQKDPQLRASAADLLQHPFLNKAFSESFERSEVECEGVSELESILGSLLLHLDARETSALDVFIVLRKPKRSSLRMTADGEARSTNGYLDVTLDVFELSESEMLQCLLFNEYPSNVIEKARALMQEMSDELEHDGTMLHVLNRFVPHASNSEVDEDRDCDCVCCSGKFDVGGYDETTNSSVRLLGLARQLHLPIALTINTARQFVEQAHSQLKLAIL